MINDINSLIGKSVDIGLSSPEEQELVKYLKEKPNNELFELFLIEGMLRGEFEKYDVTESTMDIIEERIKKSTAENVLQYLKSKQSYKKPIYSSYKFYTAIAASIIFSCGVLFYFLGYTQNRQDELVVTKGSVSLKGSEFSSKKILLPINQLISTHKNSEALLKFRQGSRIKLNDLTSISVANKTNEIIVDLKKGKLNANIKNLNADSVFKVHTEEFTVSVIGTQFIVTRENSLSSVKVLEGTVKAKLHGSHLETVLHEDDLLSATRNNIFSGTAEVFFRDSFEGKALSKIWSNGLITKPPLGNNSLGNLASTQSDELTYAMLSDTKTGLFAYDPSISLSFRYYARKSCRWVGVWIRLQNNEKYYLGVKFTPDKWINIKAPLKNARKISNKNKSIPPGSVIIQIAFQAGHNKPDSKLFIDDVNISKDPLLKLEE